MRAPERSQVGGRAPEKVQFLTAFLSFPPHKKVESDSPDAGYERAYGGAHVGASHAVDAQEEAGSLTLVGETVQSARSDVLSRYSLVLAESSG